MRYVWEGNYWTKITDNEDGTYSAIVFSRISNDIIETVTWHKDDTQLTIAQKIKAGKDTADFIGKFVVVTPLIMDINPTFGASSQLAVRFKLAKSLVPRFGKRVSKLVKNLNLGKFVKKIGDYEVFENGEVFYRTMSKEHYDELLKTNKILATGETTTSPNIAFSENYKGYLVKFKVKRGTIEQLENIGIAGENNKMVLRKHQNLKRDISPWNEYYARFKLEKGQVNIALGKGKALEIFNNNIEEFKLIKEIKK